MMRKRSNRIIVYLVVAAIATSVYFYRKHAARFEETDDAFLEGEIVFVTSRVSGHVESLPIVDNQQVEKDQILLTLDARHFEEKLKQAEADIAMAKAELNRVSNDLQRYQILVARDEVSKQKFGNVQAEVQAAQARLQAAEARYSAAQLEINYSRIQAPWAGRITKKSVELGSYVQVGQPLLAIVSPKFWVVANFKETQIGRMKAGQAVSVHVDALEREFKAHVESIQTGSGARFSLFPPENATGNFVKVVQRVPVKIVFDEPLPELARLGPGLSVVAEVHVQ